MSSLDAALTLVGGGGGRQVISKLGCCPQTWLSLACLVTPDGTRGWSDVWRWKQYMRTFTTWEAPLVVTVPSLDPAGLRVGAVHPCPPATLNAGFLLGCVLVPIEYVHAVFRVWDYLRTGELLPLGLHCW